MALFGNNPPKPREGSSSNKSGSNTMFLDFKGAGTRIIRMLPGELDRALQVRKVWMVQNPETQVWTPQTVYRKGMRSAPFHIGYYDGWNSTWVMDFDNPVQQFYQDYNDHLPDEERREKAKWPKTEFYMQVYDLTPVKMYGDRLPEGHAPGTVRIFNASGVVVTLRQEDADRGETELSLMEKSGSVLGKFLFALKSLDEEGELQDPYTMTFRFTVNPDAAPANYYTFSFMDKDVRISEDARLTQYDYPSWIKKSIWPSEVLEELMTKGGDYMEFVKEHGIQLYPNELTEGNNTPQDVTDDSDIPF